MHRYCTRRYGRTDDEPQREFWTKILSEISVRLLGVNRDEPHRKFYKRFECKIHDEVANQNLF